MAGLIQQQMVADPTMQAPPGDPTMGDPTLQMSPAEDGSEVDESDPVYRQAMQFMMSALYESGAAEGIAEVLVAQSNDPASALADAAYNVIDLTEEKLGQPIPDELLALFAVNTLTEIGEIASAAQIPVQASDLSEALKQMILRFLGENGYDTTQLQAAMDQVDPAAFNEMSAEGQQQSPTDEVI